MYIPVFIHVRPCTLLYCARTCSFEDVFVPFLAGRRNPSTANSAHSRPQTTPTSQSNPYVGNKQSAAKDLTPNSAPTPHKPHTLTRPPSTPSQQPARAREKEAPSSSSSSSSTKRDDKDDPIKKGPPHHHLPDAKPKHHAEIVPTGSKAVPAGSSKVIKQVCVCVCAQYSPSFLPVMSYM